MDTTTHLAHATQQMQDLERARRALAQAKTVRQVKEVRDRAESVRAHAQRASLGFDIQNFAAELKLQAERFGGYLLHQMKLRGGQRPLDQGSRPLTLSDMGIDKNQSARWQLEASVPEAVFRDFVRTMHAHGREISSSALIRIARDLRSRSQLDQDEQTSDADHVLPLVVTDSHLLAPDALAVEPLRRSISELSELIAEIRNHHSLLMNLIESVCSRANLEFLSADYRAIRRYVREIDENLVEIARGLGRLQTDPALPAWDYSLQLG